MILERVISGFQSGIDIAAIRAATAAGIPTGGWMPAGFRTEYGPRPEYAELYGAAEHESAEWPPRTFANARDSDGTLWIGSGDSRGYGCTMKACRAAGNRPVFKVLTRGVQPQAVADWIIEHKIRVLNCAGNRESGSPGIGERAEAFLTEVFSILKASP